MKLIKRHFFLIALLVCSIVYFAVALKINFFRYNNFDYGKFDLGNMTQMVWNVTQGNGLTLTDYFGANMPRWGMSHVDPILYIFVPIFLLFKSPMTLVVSQLILVIFSSILVFLIAKLHLKSDLSAFLVGMAYLLNPSIGFLTAWTGFHGVTAVIPFFLAAFYIFELMFYGPGLSKKGLMVFWLFLILTMMGKEQLPLYIFMYGIFILFLRNPSDKFSTLFKSKEGKLAASMMIVGLSWFYIAFFVIIPRNAHYRVDGYADFARKLGLGSTTERDVSLDNYFLNRYDEFGDSYSEVIKNMVLQPQKSIRVFFSGDKVENFTRTLTPVAWMPFVTPFAFAISAPDFLINYLTTAGGIGTSEIMNHRVSMIIPILFISSILGIAFLSKKDKRFKVALASIVLGATVYSSHVYNNPIYLWTSQAVKNKIVSKVFAKTNPDILKKNLEIGDVISLTELEDKDRECAQKIVTMIPDGVSVSGPDSLGSHLSMRETYAIFPALYNEADYVIVDVFARKILTILDTDVEIVKDVVKDLIIDENYTLKLGCGNYFVFENIGAHEKETLLPIQERFEYTPKVDMPFFQGLTIADYEFPQKVTRGKTNTLFVTYFREENSTSKNSSLEEYMFFTSFINKDTGEIYQQANLPSFAIKQPTGWTKDRYYLEEIEFVMPTFLDKGDYMVFVGMSNKIRTRSIYLGDLGVE